MKKVFIYISSIVLIALASCTVTYPAFVTTNPIGSKTGIAEKTIILGITLGHTNIGIEAAAKNGNIKKIATVDYLIKGGAFKTTYQTIVTGE